MISNIFYAWLLLISLISPPFSFPLLFVLSNFWSPDSNFCFNFWPFALFFENFYQKLAEAFSFVLARLLFIVISLWFSIRTFTIYIHHWPQSKTVCGIYFRNCNCLDLIPYTLNRSVWRKDPVPVCLLVFQAL